MAGLKIIRLGHPKLRLHSKTVKRGELKGKRFQKFLDNLASLCIKSSGAGIAAPQVGVNKRVIVVHVDPSNPRYPGKKPFPLTIIINPKIISHSKEKKEDWEGDLSVDLRGLVARSDSCVVTGLDRDGKEVFYDLKNDFHARVFQHEIDHLDGIMFVDRVKNTKSLSEYKEWKKYLKKKV
jgi:peptide deformylase